MSDIVTSFLLLLVFSATAHAGDFAEVAKKCDLSNEEKLNSCLFHIITDLQPYFKTGIPALNIPKLDPMKLPEFRLDQGGGRVSVRSSFNNILVSGLSDFRTKFIRASVREQVLEVSLHIPMANLTGNYVIDGQVVIFRITGDGVVEAFLGDVDVLARGILDVNGKYLHMRNTKVTFEPRQVGIEFHNLFPLAPRLLGDAVNAFLNVNAHELLDEVKPNLTKLLNQLVESVMNDALSAIPFDRIIDVNTFPGRTPPRPLTTLNPPPSRL